MIWLKILSSCPYPTGPVHRKVVKLEALRLSWEKSDLKFFISLDMLFFNTKIQCAGKAMFPAVDLIQTHTKNLGEKTSHSHEKIYATSGVSIISSRTEFSSFSIFPITGKTRYIPFRQPSRMPGTQSMLGKAV